MKTIGILGGMGPEATADLYLEIVKIFQKEYGAKYDADFPPFFIFSLPIPDVVKSLEDENKLIFLLQSGVRKLEEAGAEFIIVACNTIYAYLNQMQEEVSIPIISLPQVTLQKAKENEFRKVGVLASNTSLKKFLFQNQARLMEIEVILPNEEEQQQVTTAIMNVLSGSKEDKDKNNLLQIMQKMKQKGAQAVILGCTELPLLIQEGEAGLPLLNTTKILAQSAVIECRQNIYKQKLFRGT